MIRPESMRLTALPGGASTPNAVHGTLQDTLVTGGTVKHFVTLRTGEKDLHSGIFGGAALNAAAALIQTLNAALATDGRLAEPLRRGIVPPTTEELASWRELPPGDGELADQGARPADPAAADEFYIRTFAEPALDVNGIESGSPHLQKTVLPVAAAANVSIRLAPGQNVTEIAEEFRRLITGAAPAGADLDVELLSTADAAVVAPDSKAIKLGADAFERVMGVRPVLTRTGGSVPLVAALSERGIPTILTGFVLPDAAIHSPNEKMLVEYFPTGIATARALFEELRAV